MQDSVDDFEIKTFITYDPEGAGAIQNYGSVNLHPCRGTYQTNINTMYVKCVNDILTETLTKSEILKHCRFYINIMMDHPTFSSQNKVELSNNISSKLNNIKAKLKTKLLNNIFFKKWFAEVIANKKASNISKKARKSSKRVGSDNPLKDCIQHPGETLYIVEGSSAGGTLCDIRNIKNEAMYPLSGKILNTATSTTEKAIDSKKMKYLFESIGVDFKDNNYRYKKYKILTDADYDGMHIAVLLELTFWKYCRPLIEAGRVSLILPPLFGTWIKSKFKPLYTKAEADKYQQKGHTIDRYKGLGEMSPDELLGVIRTPLEYIIKPPSSTKDENLIMSCICNSKVKQALCNAHDKFNLNKVISACY